MLVSDLKRVVIDTSVLVSGILALQKKEETSASLKILRWIEAGQLLLEGNCAILAEYEKILLRKINDGEIDSQKANFYIKLFRDKGLFNSRTLLHPLIYVSRDPSDGIYFISKNCLDAHFLITGNEKHFAEVRDDLFKLKKTLQIVSPSEFVCIFPSKKIQ